MSTTPTPTSAPSRRPPMMDTDRLIRWSGLTLILAGVLFGLFPFLHPNHDPAGFSSVMWVPAHLMPNVGAVVALLGLFGVFARQLRPAGWLGVAALVASVIGTASFVAGAMIEAFIIPYLSLEFTEVVLDDEPPPGVGEAFLVIRMLFMVGFILLGAAVLRAGHYRRDIGILLIAAALFNTLGDLLIGDPAFYLGSALFGFGLGWLGLAMWKDQSGRPGVSRLRHRPAAAGVAAASATDLPTSAPVGGVQPSSSPVPANGAGSSSPPGATLGADSPYSPVAGTDSASVAEEEESQVIAPTDDPDSANRSDAAADTQSTGASSPRVDSSPADDSEPATPQPRSRGT